MGCNHFKFTFNAFAFAVTLAYHFGTLLLAVVVNSFLCRTVWCDQLTSSMFTEHSQSTNESRRVRFARIATDFDNSIGIDIGIAHRLSASTSTSTSLNGNGNFAKQQLAAARSLINWDNTKRKIKNYVKIEIEIKIEIQININIVSSISCCCSVYVCVCLSVCVCVESRCLVAVCVSLCSVLQIVFRTCQTLTVTINRQPQRQRQRQRGLSHHAVIAAWPHANRVLSERLRERLRLGLIGANCVVDKKK